MNVKLAREVMGKKLRLRKVKISRNWEGIIGRKVRLETYVILG